MAAGAVVGTAGGAETPEPVGTTPVGTALGAAEAPGAAEAVAVAADAGDPLPVGAGVAVAEIEYSTKT